MVSTDRPIGTIRGHIYDEPGWRRVSKRGWPMRDAAGMPELTDAEPALTNLLATPQGRRILTCIQCGVCAGTCPYGVARRFARTGSASVRSGIPAASRMGHPLW